MEKSNKLLMNNNIGCDFDDKAWENIIRIMNMRVPFNDERIAALVTYGVECLPFSHHVYLIARPFMEVAPLARHGRSCALVLVFAGLPYGGQKYERQEHYCAVP
ncbi:hypothetical protein PIB30_040498 [Stylosanthes scabra]|uniref:Uncharacterized protein n=1 Tax=Stylosanthes scabra TaxID=79078 RepID=A0ABU6ZDD7_9FABA|nr:hypothetical protein [Stylosanthes scabra]